MVRRGEGELGWIGTVRRLMARGWRLEVEGGGGGWRVDKGNGQRGQAKGRAERNNGRSGCGKQGSGLYVCRRG